MTDDNSLDTATDDQQAAQDAQPHADVAAPADQPQATDGITPDLVKQALASADQDKSQALGATIRQASQQNPDEVAQALPIAAQTGLPVQTVMRNKQTIAAQNAVTPDMVESLIKNNPQTASFLSNMDNASVSHDDISNLKQIEDTSLASKVEDKAFLSWTDMANALEYHFAATTLETLAGSGNADSPAGRMAQTAMAQRRNDLQISSDLSASLTPNFEGRPLAKFLYSTVQGTADFAPEMALAAINPVLAASAFGGGGYLSESADVLERGGTEKQANAAGLGVGTINAVAGPILGPVFGALLSKSPLPEWAVNTLVHGAIPMTAMGVGQKAVDTAADPNKTWGQFFKELPATAGESVLQGVLFHALSAGYGKAKDATLGRFGAKVQDALKAEQTAPTLQKFNDLAANSKVLPRAPGKFNAFMQSATDNGPIENLWIDQEAMKKAGVTPDQLAIAVPSAAADIHDAMQNGQPFRVPAADFFTGAGGTDLAKALMPHFKTDPNGMSAAEAEEFMSGGGADQFKAEMDQATKTDEQKAAFEESAKAVERQIAERYKATGRFPDDVNASTARLGAFYKVLADSYGISPEEAYNRWGAQITGADMKGVAFDGTKTTPKEKATEIPKPEPVTAKAEPTGMAKVVEKAKKALGMGKAEEPAGPAEGADIDHALNAIRMKAPKLQGEKWPLINYLVSKGGLAKDGKLAADLRDVVGERVIGLIRKEGGKGEVDNIPADELASATGLVPTTSDNGYASPQWIRDQVEREFNNAHLHDAGEDPNVSNVLAEIQKYKIDLKKPDEKIKAAILKGRLQDAKVEAAANGFNLTNEEAREVAKLRAAGYDIIDSVDEVLERRDLQAINKVAREIGHEEIEIPGDFSASQADAAANSDAAGAGERDRANPEDAQPGDGPDATGGPGAGVEQPPGEAGAALLDLPTDSAADIARRTADQRLKGKGPQKGLNDLDLFDENGRAIDSQKEFFQSASPEKAEPFYSAVEKAAQGIGQNKGTGEQFLAQIEKTSGVKKEEIEWIGLDDFLKGKKSVTKQEVQDYIKANRVQIKEVTLGGETSDDDITKRAKEIAESEGENWDNIGGGGQEHFLRDARVESAQRTAKYGDRVLPGGQNYREVLLTLPHLGEPETFSGVIRFPDDDETADNILHSIADEALEHLDYGRTSDANGETIEFNKFSGGDFETIKDILDRYPAATLDHVFKTGDQPIYTTSHFSQSNILAHLRLDDRIDADGKKVLFVEEIQSDWHQAGRRSGYKNPKEMARLDEIRAVRDLWLTENPKETPNRWREKNPDLAKEETELQNSNDNNYTSVPDAPFKKTWHEMAFRKAVRMAAEGGYDRIGWTTGEQQAERYDLSRQIHALHWKIEGDKFAISMTKNDGQAAGAGVFRADQLEDVVGKEIAKRIIEESKSGKESNDYSGLDLKVGGEGMAGFYDKIIPQYAKKFGGKFGATVENTSLYIPKDASKTFAENTINVHSMDITPEMRKTATEQGFPLFQADRVSGKNNAAYNPDTKTIWLGKDANLSSMLHEEGHHFLNVYTALAAEPDAPERIREIADAALKKLGVPGNTVEERVAAWRGMSIDEQRDGHEKFARGFERYLFRGQAPSIELQRAFDAFRGWLKHTYISIKNFVAMHPEAGSVNEELRGVMDRMLATDDEIEYARQVRNFGNLFTSADQAGMTPDEYRSYQNLGAQSLQDAQTELQTRSLRDMALTMRLRDKSTREFNSDARAKRKAVHDEVALEVSKEPVNQVRTFLKKGEVDGKAVGGVHKIDLDTVKRMYGEGEDALWRQLQGKFGKSGVLGNGGLHPDDVARQFGFENGDAMIREMVNQPSQAERIASMTDQRMIERYGDLKDPATIARRADQAVHNEARIRSVATELNAVRKSLGKHKILHDAAKAYAANLIARQKVGDISPGRYATAAATASKLAMEAMAKGKLPEVAEAKRNQLVNEYATKLAYEAKDLVDKIRNNAKRYDKPGVRKRIGTDIEHIDALLDQYDMRKNAVARTDRQAARLKTWYDSQIAADYEPVISDDILNTTAKIHYADLTLDQLRGLDASVRSIEKTARIRKEITVEGGKMALNTVVNELVGRMIERPEKFTNAELAEPPRKGVDSILKVALDRMESGLRSGIAELTPIDYLANIFDNHEIEGPFHKYVFNKIWDANYWKNEQLADISRTFEEKTKELGDDWHKSLNDIVPNKVLLDNAIDQTPDAPVYRRLTRGDMIGIGRNMGTESNFGKMTEGHGWDPSTLWAFMRENMREQDWKAVTAEWEAFDKHWPEIEAMIRRLGGEVPAKIEARAFQTPFGELKGGYSPIEYDPLRSKLARRLDAVSTDATKSIGQDKTFYKSTTTNRSLINRSEDYTDHVNLDYHYITRRLHETIHDLAYREALIDATKIIDHPEFRDQFMRTYGREDHQNLKKFIQNVREMYARDGVMDKYEKLIQYSRQGVIMNGIGYRLSTVLKHGSSAALKSLGFVQGPGKKYLLARAARMASGNAAEDIAKARAMFPEINSRLHRMDRDFNAGEHTLYEKEGWRDKNNRFGHAMVAWSDALTAIPTAHAAYDWATTEGIPKNLGGSGKPMSHEAAIRFANSVVRQAHGTALESARSNFMHEKGMVSLLGMIYGFQNNAFGQFRDIKDKYASEMSRYQNNPALAGRVMATLVAPAITAYLVGHGLDDRPWWKQLGQAITGELASTVPGLRDGWAMAEAAMEGRDLKGIGASIPTTQILTDIGKMTADAVHEFKGKDTRIIQDAGNAIGETFHISGLGQLGKTLQYARDVHNGKQNPQTPLQYLKGATIGPPRKLTGAGGAGPSGGGFPTVGGVVSTPPPDAWKR